MHNSSPGYGAGASKQLAASQGKVFPGKTTGMARVKAVSSGGVAEPSHESEPGVMAHACAQLEKVCTDTKWTVD